jgi:DNA-directed RNA polymerase specialized sigma24 family protein
VRDTAPSLLHSRDEIIRCLVSYSDWWQPSTTSVFPVGAARRSKNLSEGFRAGLLETLDERVELCRRMRAVSDRDRYLLFLWYVEQLHVDDVAHTIGISRRQCFRRKSAAIKKLVGLGDRRAG